MASLSRRLRRHLPDRVRAAGSALLGRSGPVPAAKGRGSARRPQRSSGAPTGTPGSALISALRSGTALGEAVVDEVRALIDGGDTATATSVATTLEGDPATRDLGLLCSGIVASASECRELAWSKLSGLPAHLWAPLAPAEYARAGVHAEPERVLGELRELAGAAPEYVPAESWHRLVRVAFGYGDHDLARELFARFDQAVGGGSQVPAGMVVNRDWLRPWVSADPTGVSAPPVPDGRVSLAIMDYGHPGRDRASANLGDHVQSLASLGHIARHSYVEYTGPQDLVDLLVQLRARVRPALQVHRPTRAVELIEIDRDASMYVAIPPDTWTLAFGWYMHAIFGQRYGFPFHPNLRPLFISFHCSKRDLLTDEAIEYLKRYSPIGCRDWTTVDVLLSVDVPAFFSGCMTTTVSTVFPDAFARPAKDSPDAYVDMPAETVPKDAVTYRHSSDAVRFRSFTSNVYRAIDLLETYRRKHASIVTSRLHCYLPVRSLGVEVDFQPRNRSDPRFAGLIDITDNEFASMRDTIIARIEPVLTAILDGEASDDVYERWREINADDVAAARRRRAQDLPMPAAHGRFAAEVARTARLPESTERAADSVDVAVYLPAEGREQLPVLLSTLLARASRPVHLWLLTSGDLVPAAALEELAPGATVSQLAVTPLASDLRTVSGRAAPESTAALLALPEVAAVAHRLIVLPLGAVVTGDIAELADLDLGGMLLAAPAVDRLDQTSGFAVLHRAASRLRARTVESTELRRRAHARHRFDFDAFETDLIVLDAARWREGGMTARYVPYVEEFGLTFAEILHLEVGPQHARLPAPWYVVPTRAPLGEPSLVHWADEPTPWSGYAAPAAQVWDTAAGEARPGRRPQVSG